MNSTNTKLLNANLCSFVRRYLSLIDTQNNLHRRIAQRFLYINDSEAQAAHVIREFEELETQIKVMKYHLLKGLGELPQEVREKIPQLTEAKVAKAKLPARYVKDRERHGCKPITEPSEKEKICLLNAISDLC